MIGRTPNVAHDWKHVIRNLPLPSKTSSFMLGSLAYNVLAAVRPEIPAPTTMTSTSFLSIGIEARFLDSYETVTSA